MRQATIIGTLTGQLGVQAPPPLPRPGPKPRSTGHNITVLGRRISGGINEQSVVGSFAAFRRGIDGIGEPGDEVDLDLDLEVEGSEKEEDEYEWIPKRRYNYTREHKLAAIEYYQTTWDKIKDTFARISVRRAAFKLKISRKMLRSWVLNKDKIMRQPVGSRRSRQPWKVVKEQEMEHTLNARFVEARKLGRKISFKWILRHARDIYSQIYPQRTIVGVGGKKHYLGFKFSPGWYKGFKTRYNIALRAGTKRAQKAPEDLRPTVLEWLRYNRRLMAVQEGSDCGKLRGPEVPVVGRFKLSEIANMDQTPLAWEFQKGRTYASKGERTIFSQRGKRGVGEASMYPSNCSLCRWHTTL